LTNSAGLITLVVQFFIIHNTSRVLRPVPLPPGAFFLLFTKNKPYILYSKRDLRMKQWEIMWFINGLMIIALIAITIWYLI